MKIKIPRLSTSNAISFCQSLPLSETADIYYFDVSEVNNYEPLPMLLTAAAIRQKKIQVSLVFRRIIQLIAI